MVIPEVHRPEIPLSDCFNTAAIDAEIVNWNRPKPKDEETRWRNLHWNFRAKLAEIAFYTWTGIEGRPRPKEGEKRDGRDVAGEGGIKSAALKDDQFWNVNVDQARGDQWLVFLTVEHRDLGPLNPRQQDAIARGWLDVARWAKHGRWFEPVATIWGWSTPGRLEHLKPEPHVKDGSIRRGDSGRWIVNWRHLEPWPKHPRPCTVDELRAAFGIAANEDDRQAALRTMRGGLFDEGERWKGD